MSKYEIMSRYAKGDDFVILDLETSHFHPKKGGRIIEIGAVKVRDTTPMKKFNQLIDPGLMISQDITDLTGITNDDLEGKPKYWDVLPKFRDFIGCSTVVCHNSMFDWDRFLSFYFDKLGIDLDNRVIDTMVLARKIYPKQSLKLGDLCDHVGVELKNAHRAIDDAEATAKLFLEMRQIILDEPYEQVAMFDIV